MTGQADFTPEAWALVLEAPPTAGLIVATAQRGGTFRESFAIGKAYAEARGQHGASQLLDEVTNAKPKVDHSRFHSFEELKQHGLGRLRDAAATVRAKASPEEADEYVRFVVTLADRVANAHREDGASVTEAERAAIAEIEGALGNAAQPGQTASG